MLKGAKGRINCMIVESGLVKKFLDLFSDEYNPNVYAIRATQDFRKKQEYAVGELKEPIFDEITSA
ncbi:hypothetical protein ACB094_01G091700 [Castanea mollissima]